MRQYHEALRHVLKDGIDTSDRTGVGTKSVFGYQMRFNLQDGFPAVTTKKLAWRAVVGELLWFLEGSTDERRLAEITFERHRTELVGKRTIWTANADNQGKALGHYNDDFCKVLGPVYGYQWRNFTHAHRTREVYDWQSVDQIERVVDQIRNEPDSRRIFLSAWNPLVLRYMALPPCHVSAQFRVINNKLSCHMYQRSADLFLGVPFNIASYALLTHILASVSEREVGELIISFGDLHIYNTHIEVVNEQLKREPKDLPQLMMPQVYSLAIESVRGMKVSDFVLVGYEHDGELKAEMAV